jgi:hypothetical protein
MGKIITAAAGRDKNSWLFDPSYRRRVRWRRPVSGNPYP